MNQAAAVVDSARRTVLITGAARRLGRAIALGFAARGWDVGIHFHESALEAASLCEQIVALGRRAALLRADLADEAAVGELVSVCEARLGPLTCIVNNASLFEADTGASFGYDALARMTRVNVAAPVRLARALHEACLGRARDVETGGEGEPEDRRPAGGTEAVVINLLDQKLFNLNPDYLSYTLSKAALQAATVTLAQAFAPHVRVVGIAPGITLPSGDQSDDAFRRAHRMTPLNAASDPDDIVEAVLYLSAAKAVTGTTLLVDGGQHLWPSPRDVMFLTGD